MTLMQTPSTCTHPDFRDPQGSERPGKYCCACSKRFCVLVPEFIRRTRTSDPARHVKTDLIIDTNVKAEIYTLGDLCRMLDEFDSLEACLASPDFRYRQRRTKHSIILAWWLAQNRVSTGHLGAEGLQIITEKLAPETHTFSFMMTTAIVHIILPMVMEGWPIGALVEVDHLATGTAADSELLRVAKDENLPVMTWEAFNTDGTFSSNPQKLRNRCHAEGVRAYTPEEYLRLHKVDVAGESIRFLKACDNASWTAQYENVLEGRKFVDDLIFFYRFVLLDEVP